MSFRLQIPTGHSAELNWIASVIFEGRLGLNVEITESGTGDYVLQHAGKSLLLNNDYFSRPSIREDLPASMPALPLGEWDLKDSEIPVKLGTDAIPVLFGRPGLEFRSDCDARLKLDVLGSAYFMLSRLEEVVVADRDIHNRFPAKASLAYAAGFLNRPVIDEYVEILRAAIERLWPGTRCKRGEFTVSPGHDIDSPSLYGFTPWRRLLRRAAGDCLKRGECGRATKDIRLRLLSRHEIRHDDPYNTFDWIMDQSERFGMTSRFYVICGGSHPEFDAEYDAGHRAIRNLLRQINQRRHSIGLHASYDAHRSTSRIAAESNRLREICAEEQIKLGELECRMHYLRLRIPDTLRKLQNAGIAADASLTFADHAGFRCGTCYDYPAFDPIARERLGITIRPLIAMESSVMDDRYMGLGVTEAAADAMIGLKDACRQVQGVFSLLWHNTQLVTEEQRGLYKAILAA